MQIETNRRPNTACSRPLRAARLRRLTPTLAGLLKKYKTQVPCRLTVEIIIAKVGFAHVGALWHRR
jgi:hypothetical protein